MTETKTDPKPDVKADVKPAAAAPAAGAKVATYRVTAPYVTLKSRSDRGALVVLGYFEGALVPETVDLDDLARHIRKGMVEKLEGPEAKAVAQQQDAAKKAEQAAAAPEDKEGAEAVADAEATRKAVEDAEAKEDADAKKEGRQRIKATDSPRGVATAKTG
jgi:hypothetical protein